MSTQLLASELLNLESSTKVNLQSDKAKTSTKYAIVYWIETKEFNVMPLSRIPKDKREQGASAILKAERRDWETKIVKIGGEWKYVNFVFYNITKGRNCLAWDGKSDVQCLNEQCPEKLFRFFEFVPANLIFEPNALDFLLKVPECLKVLNTTERVPKITDDSRRIRRYEQKRSSILHWNTS